MATERLQQQLQFLYEIDKLKTIFRRTNLIADKERFENTAEHSWHLAMYALVLGEHANAEVNVSRVVKMVLLHDLVEIDAGDTFCYDVEGNKSKEQREQQAADRIFGLLPDDQRTELRLLWEEFEAGETADAKFAVCIDRVHPLLNNYITGGGSWKRHGIVRSQVEDRMGPVIAGSTVMAELVNSILDDAVEKGMLLDTVTV